MLSKEKDLKIYFIIKLVLYTLIGVAIVVFHESLLNALKYFIGGLILLYSAEELIYTILFERKRILARDKFFVGALEFIFGFVILLFPISFESVCVIWATWSFLRESFEIREIFTELKTLALKIINGIESLALIILFISLIISPTEHEASIHLYVMLPELLLTPLIPLLDEIISEKRNRK